MSQSPEHVISYTALVFELAPTAGAAVPMEAHLLPPGPFRADDGRPYDCSGWHLDAVIAGRVAARMAARRNDTLICYEHQDLRAEWNGQKVLAAGWFKTLEWRDAKGLYATNIAWVSEAAQEIEKKQYRYISAFFSYYPATGEVLEILSVALTNTPALDGLDALADLARKLTEEKTMPDPNVAALTVERDGLSTQVASLTAERDGLKTSMAALTAKVAALETEASKAALAKETEARAALVKDGNDKGWLEPSLNDWAATQSVASLSAYRDKKAPVLDPGRQGGKGDGAATAALSKEEAEVAARMGVSHEAFAKAKG